MSTRAQALIVASVTLAIFSVFAGPTFYWLDSGELVAAAWGLGIAHPPGHPLASLWHRLFCYLPFGSIAFRITLASGVAIAAAAALIVVIVHQLIATTMDDTRRELSPPLRAGAALAAGFCFALSYPAFFQAVRTEVYALNVATLMLGVALLLHWRIKDDPRALLGGSFSFGLSLCNHHLLALLAIAPALVFVIWTWLRPARSPVDPARRRAWGRALVLVVSLGLLGLMPLSFLPLRSAQAPRVNWGAPHEVERFGWVVSARAFQKSLDRAARQPLGERISGALFATIGGLSPAGALLALAGFYFAFRRQRGRAVGGLLLGVAGFNLISPSLVGFDPFNPDAHGYLAVAVAALAPGIGLVVAVAGSTLAQRWRPAAALVAVGALALPISVGLATWSAADLREHWAAEENARSLMAQPPGSLVATSYFGSIFTIWALRETGDLAPDITVFHRNFVRQPGYGRNLERRHPEMKHFWRQWQKRRMLPMAELKALAKGRPIRLEYDLNVPPELGQHLAGAGPLLAYAAQGHRPEHDRPHLEEIRRWRQAVGAIDENETRRAMAWAHFLLASWACQYSSPALLRHHLAEATRLAPRSQQLKSLRQRCKHRR